MSALAMVRYPEPEVIPSRICSQCKTPDRLIGGAGGTVEHFVKPEWLPLERADDEKEVRRYTLKGWTQKVLDGRVGVTKHTCLNCLNDNALRDSIWSELKSKAKQLEREQNPGDSYYESLVEDWG